ncbi:MAG: cation:proton antiporter domain-containing protein [Limisphaerales bacterium]
MQGILFIRDLAVVLIIAGAAAWICQRLKLSVVVGYLVAGVVIGPFTPPFALVSDPARVETLAQVGLVFLIFSVGLNLSLHRLNRLGLSVALATIVGAVLMLNGCRLFGWALGWSVTASLFLAGMLMVSSSAIIGKVLAEANLLHERSGQMALGITVLEDVVAVAMLTLLTSLIQFGGDRPPSLLPTLGTLAAFVVFLALLALLLVPKLLSILSGKGLPEIRTLLIVGLLMSLAWMTVQAGYSLALGAFVFGAILGSTRHKAEMERTFEGLHQTFGAVFFVAIGMQVVPGELVQAWPMILAVTGLALLLRPLACTLGLMVVGNTSRQALQAGLFLTPLGEFSFVIAQLGIEAEVVPRTFYPVAVGASLLTALAAPWLTRNAEAISGRVARTEPRFVREWVTFYHDWLNRLRSRRSNNLLWRLTGKRFLQIGLHVFFVSALILSVNPIYEPVKAALGRDWLVPGGLPFLFWSVFGLLILAPVIAIWRNLTAMAMIVAESATLGSPRQARLRPLFEFVLRTVASVLLIAWGLTLLPAGWSLLGVAGGVLLLLAIVAAVFWRRLVLLQSRLEIEVAGRFRRASHATSTSAWSLALPVQSADWDLDIDEVTLTSDSAHVGQTLGQTALRQRFGCSVVGIDRQGFGIANPSAGTVLYPQDKLLLLGGADQLALAARELGRASPPDAGPTDFDGMTMETFVVPEQSPLVGPTLVELDLIRRVGVQIGGIRRGKQRNGSPRGSDRLAVGDSLLVLGTPAQLHAFRSHLLPEAPAPTGPG